jgi:hypothetical protein
MTNATIQPCAYCGGIHPGDACADATTNAMRLFERARDKAGNVRALSRIVGYSAESFSRRLRAAREAAEHRAPVLDLPSVVRAAIVRYLDGDETPAPRLPFGKRPKPAMDLPGDTRSVMLGIELSPETIAALDAICDEDPTQPTRATLLRTLLVEGLTARGYDLRTGARPAKVEPADAALCARERGWPRERVRVPVAVAEAIDHAATLVPVPRGSSPMSPRTLARVLVGEALRARSDKAG